MAVTSPWESERSQIWEKLSDEACIRAPRIARASAISGDPTASWNWEQRVISLEVSSVKIQTKPAAFRSDLQAAPHPYSISRCLGSSGVEVDWVVWGSEPSVGEIGRFPTPYKQRWLFEEVPEEKRADYRRASDFYRSKVVSKPKGTQ